MTTKISKPTCGVCGKPIISSQVPSEYSVALVGEFPGREEFRYMRVFAGQTGYILRNLLLNNEIEPDGILMTNLWGHEKNDTCLEWMTLDLMKRVRSAERVLLMGSECADALLIEANAMNYSGLWVKSPVLDAPKIMLTVNPAALMHGNMGEFELAVRKFFGPKQTTKFKELEWPKSNL